MPSKSSAQRKFFKIAAHNKEFANKNKIDQNVAREFYEADKKKEQEEKEAAKKHVKKK